MITKNEKLLRKIKSVAPCVTYNARVPSQWTLLMISVMSSVAVPRKGFCIITLLGSFSMLSLTLTLTLQEY